MVRELLLRLRLQGEQRATEMRFKREGAGAAFKQQNGCVCNAPSVAAAVVYTGHTLRGK